MVKEQQRTLVPGKNGKKRGRGIYHGHIAEHAGCKQEGPNDLPHKTGCIQGRVREVLQPDSPVCQGLPRQAVLLPGYLPLSCHL